MRTTFNHSINASHASSGGRKYLFLIRSQRATRQIINLIFLFHRDDRKPLEVHFLIKGIHHNRPTLLFTLRKAVCVLRRR